MKNHKENQDDSGKIVYMEIKLKPYSTKDLAEIYSVNYRTMRRWIKKIEKEVGTREGRYYTISQVKKIFEKLDLPGIIRIAA